MKIDLESLKKYQIENYKKVIKEDSFDNINLVGGSDLTFFKKEGKEFAIGSIVVLNKEKEIIEKIFLVKEIKFPYIPGFLSFREAPLIIKLFKKLKNKPDILMIDGQGIAHPRRFGIASHIGLKLNISTIGIAKSLLVGKYTTPQKDRGSFSFIFDKEEIIGVALRTKTNVKEIYVSIGHKISLNTSINIALEFSKYRIPEPTRLAHNLLQKIRRDYV